MGAAGSVQMDQASIVPTGCQLCRIGARIKWWCNDCNLPMCDRCKYMDHQIFGADHDIVGGNNTGPMQSKAQTLVQCQMCKTGAKIRWWCQDCKMILCDRCEFNDHQNFGIDHNIVNIKDECISITSYSTTPSTNNGQKVKVKFQIVLEHIVNTNLHFIAVSNDGSLWLGGHNPDKLQHVNFSRRNLAVRSDFNIKLFDLDISPSGFLFVAEGSPPTLKIFDEKKRETLEQLTIYPWGITSIHVSKDKKVIIGGHDGKGKRGIIIVMDRYGKRKAEYLKHGEKTIFTYPKNIATTSNGNILISDGQPYANRGRVIVIHSDGGNIQYYHGHPSVNSEEAPFRPVSLLVTPKDTILIMDLNTRCLHLLNSGYFITCYCLKDIGIYQPYSIALAHSGCIYLGTLCDRNTTHETKAKLYELEYSGV